MAITLAKNPKNLKNPKHQTGFSLLEVLISLAIFAVVLSGFAQAQLQAFKQIYRIHQKILNNYQ